MIPNMPSIGVRFDIGKMDPASRAEDAWKAFWQAVDPAAITGSLLFDGDVAEGVFCIAVQSMDPVALQAVEEAVSASDGCKAISADPMIGKGEEVTRGPLSMAGNVDSAGGLIGDPGAAHSALAAARPERVAAGPAEPAPPEGARPASELARGFAARATTIGSHAARAALSGGMMGPTASAVPEKSGVTRKRKSNVGKTILTVLVVIVVLGLIALMIFGPEPAGPRSTGAKGRTPEATPAADEAVPPRGSEARPAVETKDTSR